MRTMHPTRAAVMAAAMVLAPGAASEASAPAGPAGEDAVSHAVAAGLDWLVRHQAPEGYWKASGRESLHDVGVTALALRTLLAAGSSLDSGPHQAAIAKAVGYLRVVQDPDTGCFGEVNSHQAFLYDHAIATLALAEAASGPAAGEHRAALQRAVNFIHMSRNPYKAWRYSYPPDGNNDTSVTGWMVAALVAARDADCKVDPAALQGARLFLDEMTDPKTWRTGYISRGGYSAREPGMNERWAENQTEAMTAVATLARLQMGEPIDSAATRGAVKRLVALPPTWDVPARIDVGFWHHGTDALRRVGGAEYAVWSRSLVRSALRGQLDGGDDHGSWDPGLDPWGHRGGRTYTTALMTRSLLLADPAAGAASDTLVADRVRALLKAPYQGEALRFVVRGDDAVAALRVELQSPAGRSVTEFDADAFPFLQRGAVLELQEDGVAIHASAVLPRAGQRAATASWRGVHATLHGDLVVEVIGMDARGEERFRGAVMFSVRSEAAPMTEGELRAAALAAVSVSVPNGEVYASRAMMTGDGDERALTVRAHTPGGMRLYRVELDGAGQPISIQEHADAADPFDRLWPRDGRSVYGSGG